MTSKNSEWRWQNVREYHCSTRRFLLSSYGHGEIQKQPGDSGTVMTASQEKY